MLLYTLKTTNYCLACMNYNILKVGIQYAAYIPKSHQEFKSMCQ